MSVHYDRTRERWVVRWREAGRQRARRFASEDEARALDARVAGHSTEARSGLGAAVGIAPDDEARAAGRKTAHDGHE